MFFVRPPSRILKSAGAANSITGTVNETALATITVPAKAMGLNGILRVTTLWTYTNSGNNKSVRVRLGGISGTAFYAVTATTTATLRASTQISNRNLTNSQISMNSGLSTGFGTSTGAVTPGSIDTTIAQDIVISGQLANTGETITLESYSVELLVPES